MRFCWDFWLLSSCLTSQSNVRCFNDFSFQGNIKIWVPTSLPVSVRPQFRVPPCLPVPFHCSKDPSSFRSHAPSTTPLASQCLQHSHFITSYWEVFYLNMHLLSTAFSQMTFNINFRPSAISVSFTATTLTGIENHLCICAPTHLCHI